MQHIEQMICERRIDELVVGYPLNMNGSVGFKAQEVDVFIGELGNWGAPDRRATVQPLGRAGTEGQKKPTWVARSIHVRQALILQDFVEERTMNQPLPMPEDDWDGAENLKIPCLTACRLPGHLTSYFKRV